MKVRVIADFDAYTRGSIFDWDAGFAGLLIQRGLIERIEETESADAPDESGVERAEVDDKPKRKKK
jgi:hypothetical protein